MGVRLGTFIAILLTNEQEKEEDGYFSPDYDKIVPCSISHTKKSVQKRMKSMGYSKKQYSVLYRELVLKP